MKAAIRLLVINMVTLWMVAQIMPGLVINGGFKSLVLGGAVFMIINAIVVPLLKVMFLPLNILTFGIFTWVINVLALYFLTNVVKDLVLVPFSFGGANLSGFVVPGVDFNTLQVAILASFLIGLISNFLKWLIK